MRETKIGRGAGNLRGLERPPRRTATGRARTGARRPARARVVPSPYTQGRVWFVTVLTLVIALAGAAVGIDGRMRAARTQAQLVGLEAQLRSLQLRAAADERTVATERRNLRGVAATASHVQSSLSRINWQLQSVPSEAQLASVRSAVTSYAGCIPQLAAEIGGLGISWRVNELRPAADYFRPFTRTRIAGSCAHILASR